MRKPTLTVFWISLMLAAASCSPATDTAVEPSLDASGLGQQIAGTWLGTYELDTPDAVPTAFISTIHPDGTATRTSARAYGAGDPAQNGLGSLHHVQWEAAGPREIRWRLLHFGHDAAGNLTFVSRTHGVAEYDEAFETSGGSFHVEIFAPGDLLEPLDPSSATAQPLFRASGTSRAKRLHVRIPGS